MNVRGLDRPSTRTGRHYLDRDALEPALGRFEREENGLRGYRRTTSTPIKRLPEPHALFRFGAGAFLRGPFRGGREGWRGPGRQASTGTLRGFQV